MNIVTRSREVHAPKKNFLSFLVPSLHPTRAVCVEATRALTNTSRMPSNLRLFCLKTRAAKRNVIVSRQRPEGLMATQSRLVPRTSDPLEVPFKQLTVRALPSRGVTATPASEAIERVRGEFVEMRGFSPTLQQAARLFHLPQDECSQVLSTLLKEGFIRQTTDGRFRLITD
jgi:hypothetical protein